MSYPRLLEHLIEQFVKLPGVGRRSAERMAFWVLNAPDEDVNGLADAIGRLKSGLQLCGRCNNLSEAAECRVCRDPGRDHATVCVVEDHKHLLSIERSGSYKGIYHVLLGSIAPAEGRGPDDLKVHNLISRIRQGEIKEVVIATDPDTEGEMTALHLTEMLRPTGVRISRIGLGIPVGSSVGIC